MNFQRTPNERLVLIRRWILLVIWGGFGLALAEIRYFHQAVMGEKWQSWIPIIYLLCMMVVVPIGIVNIRHYGRTLLVAAFAGVMITGLLGFVFHAKGKPVERVKAVITVDLSEPGRLMPSENDESTLPPFLAPLSLMGLGAIGILVSLLEK